MTSYKFFITLIVIVSLANTISGDNSKEIEAEVKHRYGKLKFFLFRRCFGFKPGHVTAPNFLEDIDYEYWFTLCYNFRTKEGYYKNFIKKEKERITKEVKEEFENKKETKTEN